MFIKIKFKRIVLIGLVLGFSAGNALASTSSLNAGVDSCNIPTSLIPAAAKIYASTGNIRQGFEPKHSRAWYVTALGFKDVLQNMIAKDPSLVRNKRLLRVAATAQDSGPLQVFLSHGADPNATVKAKTSPTAPPLLVFATSCERIINMVYLLVAGANIYATDSNGTNAMLVASTGGTPTEPAGFVDGIVLLLAAGYDPRCPMAPGANVLDIAKVGLESHKKKVAGMKTPPPWTIKNGAKLSELVSILKGVEVIRRSRSEEPLGCNASLSQ